MARAYKVHMMAILCTLDENGKVRHVETIQRIGEGR
jgi:hypothetical protein